MSAKDVSHNNPPRRVVRVGHALFCCWRSLKTMKGSFVAAHASDKDNDVARVGHPIVLLL